MPGVRRRTAYGRVFAKAYIDPSKRPSQLSTGCRRSVGGCDGGTVALGNLEIHLKRPGGYGFGGIIFHCLTAEAYVRNVVESNNLNNLEGQVCHPAHQYIANFVGYVFYRSEQNDFRYDGYFFNRGLNFD